MNITGRPNDSSIEKQFMAKLRGTKLQVINAESELQMSLAKEEKNRQKESIGENDITTLFKQNVFNLSAERLESLLLLFREAEASWRFTDIKQNQPFPKFLFDDGTDLSYIINFICEKTSVEKFPSEELLFLHLLCLTKRRQLTNGLLKYIEENLDFIMKYLNFGRNKVHSKIESGDKFSVEQNDYMDQEHASVTEKSSKTKPIKKNSAKKGGKKQKKKDKNSDSSQGQQDQDDSNIDREKLLAIKLDNYICWAYFYALNQK